jgi:hypothetical protein
MIHCRERWAWRWLMPCAPKVEHRARAVPPVRRRKHAGWILELSCMLLLALLLPRPRKRK